jgi:hypothetical protein
MYKIDRDMQYGASWGDAPGTDGFYVFGGGTQTITRFNNPAYSAPFTLASLTYDGSTAIVGTTGSTGTVTNWGSYYWRGIVDDIGDEWHVLTIADYDSFVSDVEGKSSDGKVYLLVVNPKTPCLTITVTGDAQFYTTPAKIYFVPKIHNQTTYFNAGTGTIDFSLKDINGNNVVYRINGGSWSTPAANPVLHASDFGLGSNTLEYYYSGNIAYTKTRLIVKDPSYPSAVEPHGLLMFGTRSAYEVSVVRSARLPYSDYYAFYIGNNFFNPLTNFDTVYGTGSRLTGVYGSSALPNAYVASIRGWETNASGKSKTSAQYAKQMLMSSSRNLDPVGFEISHSNRSIPARELFYRGYYDMNNTFSIAFAYDMLIANYKSTQHAGGITAVEDYYIRDLLAQSAMEAMMQEGNYTGQDYTNTGMWGTARNVGGLVVALSMPAYSTSYYGTSGIDGNTTVYARTPFPDTPLTWKKVFVSNDSTLLGYPNLNYRFGVEEYEWPSAGTFENKTSYLGIHLMGHIFYIYANLMKMYYPTISTPNLDAGFAAMAAASLTSLQLNDGPGPYSLMWLCNNRFPSLAPAAVALSLSATPSTDQAQNTGLLANGYGFPYGEIWYDDNYTNSRPNNYIFRVNTNH